MANMTERNGLVLLLLVSCQPSLNAYIFSFLFFLQFEFVLLCFCFVLFCFFFFNFPSWFQFNFVSFNCLKFNFTYFLIIMMIIRCSGMFRNVPECSGMFRDVTVCSMFLVLSTANWIYSRVKNESVKLPFVTKNSNISFCLFKHFMGASGDDSSPLIEFTPLWKTKVLGYHCN